MGRTKSRIGACRTAKLVELLTSAFDPFRTLEDAGKLGAMHTVTAENYQEALEATRDILMMFVDMAEGSSGFSHAVDVAIRFDPLKFVDAELADDVVWVDIDLLRSGSAVAILAYFYDMWCEFEAVDVPHPVVNDNRYKEAVESGRLHYSPDIESVAREALKRNEMTLEDPWFDEVVQPIYRKHVLGYFRRLSEMDRSMA